MLVVPRRWRRVRGDTRCLGSREWYGCDGDIPIYKIVQENEVAGKIFRRVAGNCCCSGGGAAAGGIKERERVGDECVCFIYIK